MRSHNLFVPNFVLSLAKRITSKNSPIAKAVREEAAMRADTLKIASYDASVAVNRGVAGRRVAKREKTIKRKTIKRPDLTTLWARGLPNTSVTMSLIA